MLSRTGLRYLPCVPIASSSSLIANGRSRLIGGRSRYHSITRCRTVGGAALLSSFDWVSASRISRAMYAVGKSTSLVVRWKACVRRPEIPERVPFGSDIPPVPRTPLWGSGTGDAPGQATRKSPLSFIDKRPARIRASMASLALSRSFPFVVVNADATVAIASL